MNIIKQLEGKWIMNNNGDYHQVEYGIWNGHYLEKFNMDELAEMLVNSKSQAEYEAWYNDQQVELFRMMGEY